MMRDREAGRIGVVAGLAVLAGGTAGVRGGTEAWLARPASGEYLHLDEPAGGAATTNQPGEAPAESVPAPASPWRAEMNMWIWVLGLEGNVGARGAVVGVSSSFGDILEASDSVFAFSGRLEVANGPIGGFIDGLYSKLGAEDRTGPGLVASVDATMEQSLIDFGLMYRIGDWKTDDQAAREAADARTSLTLDLYAGGRYSGVDVTLQPAGGAELKAGRDWVDPIAGAKVVIPFAERWHLAVNGDIGGFGVSSDLTWSATAVVGYDFHIGTLPSTVMVGYRAVGWDYSDGDGSEEFVWDVVQHGFIIGLSMRF